ncbi:Uncharacterized protein TCM_026559 [Theobroma cacao]|uniref:Uncharacterized protein n=1 Tax=Theobroma cacao TaxID=3641 RepID=A0A061FA11_THECC|nr:Uncharacterized protein TCM_026559 [Theobroma cacao]
MKPISLREMQKLGDFELPHFLVYLPYFTLQPVRRLVRNSYNFGRIWITAIIRLEEEFLLFSNLVIKSTLSHEARRQSSQP